ncbi:MAG: hypothetical protein ACREIP_19125, partial [Alphaproteobacteria bacterium]
RDRRHIPAPTACDLVHNSRRTVQLRDREHQEATMKLPSLACAAACALTFTAATASPTFAESTVPGAAPPPRTGPKLTPPRGRELDKFTTRTQPPGAETMLPKPRGAQVVDEFADTRIAADRARRAADAIFAETETALTHVPREQSMWARAFATTRGSRASASEISAAVAAAFPNAEPRQRIKIHMIVLMIQMGDIVGALRSYAALTEHSQRQFSRLIVKKLDGIRRARATLINEFARIKPTPGYAGGDPNGAARAQDRSLRYTQFVQMSTQMMNELQNTERELVDALQSMQRQLDQLWQSHASFRDADFRTSDRIMTTR